MKRPSLVVALMVLPGCLSVDGDSPAPERPSGGRLANAEGWTFSLLPEGRVLHASNWTYDLTLNVSARALLTGYSKNISVEEGEAYILIDVVAEDPKRPSPNVTASFFADVRGALILFPCHSESRPSQGTHPDVRVVSRPGGCGLSFTPNQTVSLLYFAASFGGAGEAFIRAGINVPNAPTAGINVTGP